jgi:hypothetical protein
MDVLGGLALCLGATVSIGFALELRPGIALVALGVAVGGAILVYRWFRREEINLPKG